MEVSINVADLLRMGAKLVNHKITQYRLGTNETEVMRTTYGKIKGAIRKTIYDDEIYHSFEGIPYAKPPVGELRFRAPQPPEPWDDVRDCTHCSAKPIQKHFVMHIAEGDEDCLYLNVYAKKLESRKPLPVMVWLYGGGFQIGGATRDLYAPDYFMKKDVILVTVNYRLGALGFLSIRDPECGVPGNAGLKDQLMALRWVKDNIANFNGDPENITLFGESAGAASTHFLMLSPIAKGLFHRGIMQSGTAFCPWATSTPGDWGFRLARKLGYEGLNEDKEVLQFLMEVDASRIAGTDNRLFSRDAKHKHLFVAFAPVTEPYESKDCIMSKPYKEMLKDAWGNQIPLIIGGTSSEGLSFFQHKIHKPYKIDELGDCEVILPEEVKDHHTAAEIHEMGLKLKHAYFGDTKPSTKETFHQYMDLLSVKHFWHGIHRTILARLTYAPDAPTYLYRFDFDSPDFNHYRVLKCGRTVRGVCHADDLSYLFYNIASWKLSPDSGEYRTIERMIGMWTSFAITSNPNCDAILPAMWEPVKCSSCEGLHCLNISDKVEFVELPERKQLKVWDSLYTDDHGHECTCSLI